MKLLPVLALLAACSPGYNNHDLTLLTRYKAKEMCSCMFVQLREQEYCESWTYAEPNLATMTVDKEARTVHTEALLYWHATATWVDDRHGCVLDLDTE